MRYPISVVVPTNAGWPQTRLALDPLLPQLSAAGGQLIVADVSGASPPAAMDGWPETVWLQRSGEWVIRARREALRLAEGEIIALTEDHCIAAPDWIERILAAHRRHPDAAAITGAILNGTTDHAADWSLYLLAHSRLAPPIGRHPPLAGKTNISYKRAALADMPEHGGGIIEDIYNQQLRKHGHAVLGDDSIRVAHHQCSPPTELIALQFHNGRTIAGLRRERMATADYVRALLPAPLAGYRLARALVALRGKHVPPRVAAAATPLMAVMALAHAWGEVMGYAVGPGDSPHHLH